MTRPVATRIITDPHSGRTICAPAHLLAPPRVKASDVAKFGGYMEAREALWGRKDSK